MGCWLTDQRGLHIRKKLKRTYSSIYCSGFASICIGFTQYRQKKNPFSFTIVCIEIEDFISSNGGHPSNKCTDLEWYRTSWDTIEISFFVGGMHSPHHYLVHQIRSPVKSVFIVLLARTAAVKQSLGWVLLSYKYCAFNVVMLACYLASRLAPLFEGTYTQIPTVQKQPHK